MKDDTEAEENAFELDSLVVKPKATSDKAARRATPKASLRSKRELFGRITARHCAMLDNVNRVSTAILFIHLMMHSVKVFNRPFDLPVEYLVKETGMNRRQQIRAVRNLVEVGIIRTGRGGRYGAPLITIPGTTKTSRKTT